MPLFDLVGKLIEGFLRGKIVASLVGSVLLGLGVAVYLIETADTELEQHARAAAILKDLEVVMTASENPDVVSAAATIARRVKEIVAEATEANGSLSEEGHRVVLALIMGLPWAVLSLIGIVEGVRRESDWEYSLFGPLALAALFSAVAYAIPVEIHWFYRYVLIPVAVYIIVGGGLTLAGKDESEDSDAV